MHPLAIRPTSGIAQVISARSLIGHATFVPHTSTRCKRVSTLRSNTLALRRVLVFSQIHAKAALPN